MCEICNSLTINTHLADRLIRRYKDREQASPGFLSRPVETDEMDGALTDVHFGNESHAFFSGVGVRTYQDLVNRLAELTRVPVTH